MKYIILIILVVIIAFILFRIFKRKKIKLIDGGRKDTQKSFQTSWLQTQLDNFPKDRDTITPSDNSQLLTYFINNSYLNQDVNLNDFYFTRNSIFTTTPQSYSLEIISFMADCLINYGSIAFKKNSLINLIITDATAYIGGNTIVLANFFKEVNAIENDKINYDTLVHNTNLFSHIANKIHTYNKEYITICYTLTQDVIFMDPSWAGLDYKNQDKVTLFLNFIPIQKIVSTIACAFFIKAPPNFNFDEYNDYLNTKCNRDSQTITIYNHGSKEKIKFIVVYTPAGQIIPKEW